MSSKTVGYIVPGAHRMHLLETHLKTLNVSGVPIVEVSEDEHERFRFEVCKQCIRMTTLKKLPAAVYEVVMLAVSTIPLGEWTPEEVVSSFIADLEKRGYTVKPMTKTDHERAIHG